MFTSSVFISIFRPDKQEHTYIFTNWSHITPTFIILIMISFHFSTIVCKQSRGYRRMSKLNLRSPPHCRWRVCRVPSRRTAIAAADLRPLGSWDIASRTDPPASPGRKRWGVRSQSRHPWYWSKSCRESGSARCAGRWDSCERQPRRHRRICGDCTLVEPSP